MPFLTLIKSYRVHRAGTTFAVFYKNRSMKTLQYLVLALALSAPSALLGQQQQEPVEENSSRDAKKRIVPGIKVGITRSNVYDRKGEAFVSDGKSGFAGGVSLALPLGSLLGIQPEVMLLQKGFEGAGTI